MPRFFSCSLHLFCWQLAHEFDGGFAGEDEFSVLICAIGAQGDDAFVLAEGGDFGAGGDGVVNVDGGEEFEGLTEIDGTGAGQVHAYDGGDERACEETVGDAFAELGVGRVIGVEVNGVAVATDGGKLNDIGVGDGVYTFGTGSNCWQGSQIFCFITHDCVFLFLM